MSKYLIVNADDFGMCHSANEAVFDLFRDSKLFSSTIMMPCPTAEDAVRFSVENPGYAIGIHTTLTSEWKKYRWTPLTNAPSLTDENGFMWSSSRQVEKNGKTDEIEKEVRAQIVKALVLGMRPSHIDNHMGSLYGNQTGRFTLLRKAYEICGSYGLPYRMFIKADARVAPREAPLFAVKGAAALSAMWAKKYKVKTPDYLLFPDWPAMKEYGADTYEKYQKRILEIWTNLPDGVTETFVHPALETDELKGITNAWQQRVWEYNLMKDPATHAYLKGKGVEMISYNDIK